MMDSPGAARPIFVQVGATRDGLDPYLHCARRRDMRTVLVETPAYLRRRTALGRRRFDIDLAVARPHDPSEVAVALDEAGLTPTLLLTGFERYAASAFAVCAMLRVTPWPGVGRSFVPVDKWGQRNALAVFAPEVRQPRFASFPSATTVSANALVSLGFPLVVKPTDGGGGLGVFLVRSPEDVPVALDHIAGLRNYGGGEFAGLLVEQFLFGTEFSLQGVVRDSEVVILTTCEKVIAQEPVAGAATLNGFREVGHIAVHGTHAQPELIQLAQAAIAATGYRQGPFHMDVIWDDHDPAFVEMGFRLSGGAVASLVSRTTGTDWAEVTFCTHLGEPWPAVSPAITGSVSGHITAMTEQELAAADALRNVGVDVEVQRFSSAAPGGNEAAQELAADLLRHAGAIGRIIVTGTDAADVRDQLEGCLAAQLRR